MRVFCIVFLLLCIMNPVSAETIPGIRAYPVPYNPDKHTLTIDDTKNAYTGGQTSIVMEIFDITGDSVYKRSFSGFPIRWKGYSSNGERVENGLYFVKLTVEDLESGEIEKGIIRIIIKK